MKVTRINAYEFGSNCWHVIDEATGSSVIIDPSPEIDALKQMIVLRKCSVKYILLTHGHFDHMTSCDTLRDFTKAPLAIHRNDALCLTNSNLNCSRVFMGQDLVYRPADILLDDNEVLTSGNLRIKVIHTPGHSQGSVCYLIEDALFTGDTLFDRSVGRCDLPGSDQVMLSSSLEKIKNISGDYTVYSGHIPV